MKRLRGMRVASQEIYVYRHKKWQKVLSEELYPGEIVLLKKSPASSKENKRSIVPCDLLIISGSAVVNESILTGESQPLVKESI